MDLYELRSRNAVAAEPRAQVVETDFDAAFDPFDGEDTEGVEWLSFVLAVVLVYGRIRHVFLGESVRMEIQHEIFVGDEFLLDAETFGITPAPDAARQHIALSVTS